VKKSLLSVLLVTGVAGAAIAQQAVTPAAPPATAHTAADQMKGAAPAQAAFTPPVPPPRKLAPPVPALLQSRAHEVWTTNCVACHGNTIEPGAKAKSLFSEPFLNSRTDAQIVQTTANGPQGVANHGFKTCASAAA
jgi:mono/diheme cytochrome c family protein